LFEILTGRSLFVGESMSDVLAEVLKTAPDFALLPSDTPVPVRRLLRRCLHKDKQRRLLDIEVIQFEIADALEGAEVPDAPCVGLTPAPVSRRTGPGPALDMLFVQHWFEELTDLVPVN